MSRDLSNIILQFSSMLINLEDQGEELTLDLIKQVVSCNHPATSFFKERYDLKDNEIENISIDLETQFNITQEFGHAVQAAQHEEWLFKRRQSDEAPETYYWDRLNRYLKHQNELPNKVIISIDKVTDHILDLAGDPTTSGEWFRRGMVLGHVQSGKTSNYSALICKAADYGYKVIVLLTGMTNSLRTQTQQRINETFVGREASDIKSVQKRRIGVGLFSKEGRQNPATLTTNESDFKTANVKAVGGLRISQLKVPLIFVCKKHSGTLQNLNEYFEQEIKEANKKNIDTTLLLIDDEADNASINTKYDKGEITKINEGIRLILKKFNKKSYIGYTATPFANIFIDINDEDDLLKDDLFPRDFIKSLDAPTNYIGPNRIFKPYPEGDLAYRMIRSISDYRDSDCIPDKHKKNHVIEKIPESLEQAIRLFILAKAIRVFRGDGKKHCTMMVNVTIFTDVQSNIEGKIQEYLDEMRDDIIMNCNIETPDQGSVMHILEKEYEKEFKNFKSIDYFDDNFMEELDEKDLNNLKVNNYKYPKWDDIKKLLIKSVQNVEVLTINSKGGELKYEKKFPKTVIAIGGYALSRGLTLEGLCISYVIRKASAYDTLMQMGRWFGYRQNYEDLCRLFLPLDSILYYQGITEAIDELRSEIKQMESYNLTPLDFGLKVREHPEAIRITAANKMRSAEKFTVEIGFAGQKIETHTHFSDNKNNDINLKEARLFFSKLGPNLKNHNYFFPDEWKNESVIWQDVPVDNIIRFLNKIKIPNKCRELFVTKENTSLVTDFIEEMRGLLQNWTVLFNNSNTQSNFENCIVEGINFISRKRNKAEFTDDDEKYFIFNKQKRMSDSNDIRLSFLEDEYKNLRKSFEQSSPNPEMSKFNYWLKSKITKPILVFYIIDISTGNEKFPFRPAQDIISLAIHFPKNESLKKVKKEYYLNRIKQMEESEAYQLSLNLQTDEDFEYE
ncbi:Z1 domain-containing protein [Alphaproteobacteria bacterium]|nr:Z1 domain-containing protein [Alphaproteobacteria bacterium]